MTEILTKHTIQERETTEHQFVVDQLSYHYPYGSGLALQDVSFTLNRGEYVGIHGLSGSGKTTLLYTLSGLIPHFYKGGEYSGSVDFQGSIVKEYPGKSVLPGIAFISQNPQEQLFGKTVEDAISFGLENRNIPRTEMVERIDEVTNLLQINHIRARDIRSLSGGEAQAALIAAMVSFRPSVLLFDEVISALDPAAVARVQQIIRSLHSEGMTIILSDSDAEWASRSVGRSLVLENGRLIFDGHPATLSTRSALADAVGFGNGEREAFQERRLGSPIAGLDAVTFGYGAVPVVENISLHVPGESCTAIIGHNGSGKSTVGKLLAGYMEPMSGTVHVRGKNVSKLPASQAVKEVTYMFQRPSQMFSEQTVQDEFMLSPRELQQVPSFSLEDFGLAGTEALSPHELSAGQQQRLAQAATFVIGPELLILDEPTRGQTRKDRDQLVQRIGERSDSGRATVLITHDMSLAMSAADYVVVMDHGQVIRQDRASRVFADQELFDQLGFTLPERGVGGDHE